MSTMQDLNIDYNLSKLFDIGELKNNICLPIEENELYIKVACCKESCVEFIQTQSNKPLKLVQYNKNEILFELDYLQIKQNLYDILNQVRFNASQNGIKEFLHMILEFAIMQNSSDIHIESQSKYISCKLRIDGVLILFFKFDLLFFPMISSIIKLYSNLDITKKREPQNSRFALKEFDSYDFRVSCMPTISGESIVIRILEKNFDRFDISKLGFSKQNLEIIKNNIVLTSGMILVTGPTGSGKTTTLYSIIKELKNTNKKIITIEDPVEYKIDNITQISLNHDLGLTYSEILKNILRQDPDILLIGEIRDKESLQSAISASLTGHLVFATLHTNDAISTIYRLLDMEAQSFLIASVLKCIIAQRLVRVLCDSCKNSPKRGCKECNQTGYKSRTTISEVLKIDENLASMISKKEPTKTLREYANNQGFVSIYEDGIQKVMQNITTKEEQMVAINL